MAYTLNTSHALYGNIVELIGVQGGALISHKTARTFTKHADATYGTGTYGEHFSAAGSVYSIKGASISPAIVIDTYTNPNYSVLVVLNAKPLGGNRHVAFLNNNGGNYTLVGPAWSNSNLSAAATAYTNILDGATTLGTGEVMLTTTRSEGAGNAKLYVNASLDGSGTPEGWNASATINYIGGYDGQAGYSASVVWIVVFNKVLSQSEISDLYASLGANNAFGLVQAAGNAAPTFPGPNIGNLSGTVGTALTSNNVASKFSDTDALTFSAVGTWPPGVTVSSAGVISGTPTTAGTYASLKVRATDTAAQTVDSDTFSFTINASAHLVTVANSQQVNTASTAAIQQSGNGTITLPALKDWGTGNLKASETGVTIIINNATTGVLVALLTGQTANASGVLPTLTGLVSGTAYRVTTILADGSEGTWKYTAS